ncbi:tol-pal system protein YbgF [bacterium BMS3Abin05]|nr:tol-pal system protein YbgF [bacterium BMS3Abin05]GBE28440.1 tol-pal system protein YbgF [bacterium BMS3Bbin03]HDK35741.1 tetratricopeptide repeat protein [Bacteroidota bacterium]HDL77975.1 tetratricopeptide repeat protein [Bacteroidota bacterium]HDZ10863.1 tetratricopeptide repeat protein [Bacteroidota bacterium]
MRTLSKVIWFGIIFLFLTGSSFSENQRKYGIGIDSGFQRVQGGSAINYFSAVYGLYGVYNLSPQYSVHLRASYGKLTSNNGGSFWSSITPLEAFFSYKFLRTPTFEPALHLGAAVYRFTNQNYAPKHYFDGAVFPGIDLQYYPLPNISVLFSADYKITTGKSLDNVPNVRDGYMVFRGGLTYYWMKESAKKKFRPKRRTRPPGKQVVSKNTSSSTQVSTVNEEDVYLKTVELKSTIDDLQQQLKLKNAQINELKVLLNIKKEKISVLDDKINNLQNQLASGKTYPSRAQNRKVRNDFFTAKNTAAGSHPAIRNFRLTYRRALQEFNSRKYTAAIEQFSLLIQSNPNHPLASNCYYWIGESYYALKNYQKAEKALKDVLAFTKSYKKEPALLMLGLSYLRMGERVKAKEQFQALIQKYPTSPYSKKARLYLSKIERAVIS